MADRPILYVAPKPPTVGGVADYAARYRVALETAGIRYHDVALPSDTPQRTDIAAIQREVAALAASGELAKYRLAHVEIARFTYREFWYAHFLRKYSDLPLVITVHEPGEVIERPFRHLGLENKPKPLRSVGRALDRGLAGRHVRKLLARADRVVTLGSYGQHHLRTRWSLAAGKGVSIPHVSYASVRRRAVTKRLDIVFAGFAGAGKGLPTLLEAYHRLLDRGLPTKTRLVITGGGFAPGENPSLDDALRSVTLPEANLDVLGFLTERELQELFARAAVVVVPFEPNLPAASSAMLIRAMSAGVAIAASDLPSLTQNVEHGQTALVFRAGNAVELSEALRRLVGSKTLRDKLGRAAAAKARKEHSPKAVGKVVAALYDQIAP